MTIKHLAIPITLSLFLGCSAPLHLYPVKNAPADQTTPPVIAAKATGITSGTISFRLPTGEFCEGPWAPVPQGKIDNELVPTWDSIYGAGHYLANVLGSKWHGNALITGSNGTIFQLEFYRDTIEHAPLLGIAKDNHGNIYKVTN